MESVREDEPINLTPALASSLFGDDTSPAAAADLIAAYCRLSPHVRRGEDRPRSRAESHDGHVGDGEYPPAASRRRRARGALASRLPPPGTGPRTRETRLGCPRGGLLMAPERVQWHSW